jgi:hypothetical protein
VRGELSANGTTEAFIGQLEGNVVRRARVADGAFELTADRRRLVMQRAGNPLARPPAIAFVPPARDGCR